MSHKNGKKKRRRNPPFDSNKRGKSIHFMNKACTFLMVCLFVSLGGAVCVWGKRGGGGGGGGHSGDNLRGPSPICVYPDTRHLAEVEYPHYYSNVFPV